MCVCVCVFCLVSAECFVFRNASCLFLVIPGGYLADITGKKGNFFFQNHKKSFNFYAVQCPRAGALPYTFHTNDFVSSGGIWASFLFPEK